MRVRSRNGLARYSVNNQLLLAFARPNATFVAGFRAWLELGYQVGKGEKAIWILAPLKIKERDRASGEETGETRTLFRAVPVFDRAQVTAGEHATPLEPPVESLSGDSHEHLLEPLERFAGSLGFIVSFETIDGPAGGWCDYKRKRIVVDADQPANARVRVLIHEIAHAMGVDYQQYSRAQAEVIVDTAIFCPGDRNSRWRLTGACVTSVTDGAASSSFTVRSAEQRGRAGLLSGRTVNRSDDEKLKAPKWPTRSTRSTMRLPDKRRLGERVARCENTGRQDEARSGGTTPPARFALAGSAGATSALVGGHDEDAAGCVVGHLVRHAARKEPRREAHAPAAHDQQLGVLLLGDCDQRLGGVIAPRVRDGL